MTDRFSASDSAIIDRDNRNMAAANIAMSEVLNDLQAQIDTGTIGITAAAADVDSVAKGGGHFPRDADTTSGLTFGYGAGRVRFGQSVVSVAAGTILLSASAVNYVEVDSAGTVSKNTSAFTASKVPLWKITTGSSTISLVEQQSVTHVGFQAGGLTGDLLSTAGATKSLTLTLGTISATATFSLALPAFVAHVAKITFVGTAVISASDTDYWKFGVVNKGAAGSSTTAVVDDTVSANSTKATGGTALAANIKRALTLSGTSADLDTASEDVLLLTVTKTGSPSNLTAATIRIDLTFAV